MNIATKSAFLCIVIILDLAAIVAFRNAPYFSWINPVERVMIILNLGLQHCEYARKFCTGEMEKKLKSLKTMKSLLEESDKDGNVKKEWI